MIFFKVLDMSFTCFYYRISKIRTVFCITVCCLWSMALLSSDLTKINEKVTIQNLLLQSQKLQSETFKLKNNVKQSLDSNSFSRFLLSCVSSCCNLFCYRLNHGSFNE